MITDICLSKPAQDKKERVTALLNEVAELYEKREYMINYERDMLTALYTGLIGRWQYELFKLETQVKKLKRTSELIQAQLNRGERVNMKVIERIVEKEFEDQQRKLDQQLEQLKKAHEWLEAPILEAEEAAELKDLYRTLMKRLHPDWNPTQTEQEKELFMRAKAAYNSGDLQELRNILLMCDRKLPTEDLTPDAAEEQIAKLEQSIRDLQSRIDQLNASFPFDHREKLEDNKWVEEEQARLQERIRQLDAERSTWETYLTSQMNPKTIMAQA
jgi:hypothetical protein